MTLTRFRVPIKRNSGTLFLREVKTQGRYSKERSAADGMGIGSVFLSVIEV